MKYTPESVEVVITGNEDTVKISTVVFFVLGLIIPLWLITLPICWFIAYRTFKSGDGTPIMKGETLKSNLVKTSASDSKPKFDDIEQLKKLLDSGALTEDEFSSEKAKILNSST